MYEASGCASVTSARSAFSVPVAVICCSCKPAALCAMGAVQLLCTVCAEAAVAYGV